MAVTTIQTIRSEDEYDAALLEIEAYFDNEPKPGTAAARRFEVLAKVIEEYENRRWPISGP
jgi:HTH-type transcriptional regulator/antitoxin HigA